MIKGRAMGRESKQRVDPAASFDATRPETVSIRARARPGDADRLPGLHRSSMIWRTLAADE